MHDMTFRVRLIALGLVKTRQVLDRILFLIKNIKQK